MGHLFDLIDWGSDKGLEKCYRFVLPPVDYAPSSSLFASEYFEGILEIPDYLSGHAVHNPVAAPFNNFWVEYDIFESRELVGRNMAYCFSENHLSMNLDRDRYPISPKFTLQVQTFFLPKGYVRELGTNKLHDTGGILMHYASSRVLIGEKGEVLDHVEPESSGWRRPLFLSEISGPARQILEESVNMSRHVFGVDRVLQFLESMTMLDMIHHTPNRQQQRKAARKGNLPLNEYYELTKYPKGKHPSRSVSSGNKSQGLNRHHSVMGNWAYYSPDSPMLGHTSGWVWRPAHMRGNKRRGTIDKDYVVKDSAI